MRKREPHGPTVLRDPVRRQERETGPGHSGGLADTPTARRSPTHGTTPHEAASHPPAPGVDPTVRSPDVRAGGSAPGQTRKASTRSPGTQTPEATRRTRAASCCYGNLIQSKRTPLS